MQPELRNEVNEQQSGGVMVETVLTWAIFT